MSAPGAPPSILESFNFAFEGIIHVLRTQRNMRIHFLIAALVLIAALFVRRRQAGADRAPARDRVRPDRGDAEHRGRGGGRRRDDLVRPDGEAREGHRRRRGSDRDRSRRRRRLPRLLRPGRRPELEAARPAHERAGRADAGRARADLDPRDRDEGAHRPRLAAPRRPAVRPRRNRLCGLDGCHADPRRLAQPLPDLVADLHHGVARGPDTCRIRSALVAGGRLRRHSRRARHARRLPGVRNDGRGAARAGSRDRGPSVLALLEVQGRLRDSRARRHRLRRRQRRERRVPARDLRREERDRRRGHRGLRLGDFEAIAITPRRAAAAASGSASSASTASSFAIRGTW